MALLPVLIITGLITVVVILLFSLSNTLLRTSSGQSASYQTTALRDMAINMAIAQLRQGTTEPNAIWISQPGAVRTYGASTGVLSNVYKLYSNKHMVVAGSTLDTASKLNLEDDVPSNAPNLSDVFVNMNRPNIDGAGRINFPIVDPRAEDTLNSPNSATPEGFSYSLKQEISGNTANGSYLPASGPSKQRLAMEMQWIYVLADGGMGVIDANTRLFVPFSGQSAASSANPMVGRFAFWTDDESCKINVNTAGEGIYWDTPRCATNQEVAFAKQPPVNMEVQRYGGHPATTCLSSVFYPGQRLLPSTKPNELKQLYDMTPRVSYKDKNGAPTGAFLPVPAGPTTVNPVSMSTSLKRLYASVDDFMLAPDRTEQPIFTTKPNLRGRLRFFLTAESRAPEITASGHPRVSLWPVNLNYTDTTRSTIFDNLSRFSSTLGNTPYHFRRTGTTTNINIYINKGGGYANASNDPMGIGPVCNANLTLYLIELAKIAKHGYPKSFAEKYDQRTGAPLARPYNTSTGLLDCMDYTQGVNLTDNTTAVSGSPIVPFVQGWDSTPPSAVGQWNRGATGFYQAQDLNSYPSPLDATNTMLKNDTDQVWTNGMGREYNCSEFGLQLMVAAEHKPDGTKINSQLVTKLNLPQGYKAIQIAPIFEGFCPAQGYAGIAPTSVAKCTQMNTLRLLSPARGGLQVTTGGAVTNPVTLAQAVNTNWGSNLNPSSAYLGYLTAAKASYQQAPASLKSNGSWWVPWGGSGGRSMYIDNDNMNVLGPAPTADIDDPSLKYWNDYSRGFFIIPSAEKTVTLQSIRALGIPDVARCLEISIGCQRNGDFTQHRILIEVPDTIIPVPDAPAIPAMQVSYGVRLKNANANRFNNPELVDANDVIRTWVVRHGDHRLTSIRQNEGGAGVGAATAFTDKSKRLFISHTEWNPYGPPALYLASQSKKQIHSFTKSGGKPEPGATFMRGIVRGVTYADNVKPDFTINPDATPPRFDDNIMSLNPSYPYKIDPSDTRDWDNGTGIAPDGAYWNKADDVAKVWDGSVPPYFSEQVWDGDHPGAVNQTTAPNQLIPSAVVFGSINSAPSTGVQWTTYLFRPDITPGGHLGAKDHSTMGQMTGAPPDHLMLDWFWMPVVQPYAISEPFSTAGKINMNYRIVPFTHINRATGMHAVLKSEQILAIPTSAGLTYKDYTKAGSNGNWRHYIDATKTLLQWEAKFNKGQFFKNASEVCEQFLVPEDPAYTAADASQMTAYWNNNQLTGDNTLERPYANIYPRLTTRSNTFRVHFFVQTMTKARSSDPTKYTPSKDSITGESQGDALVERAIDPNDPALSTPDYNYIPRSGGDPTAKINLTGTKSLDNLFTWRIRNIHRFSR